MSESDNYERPSGFNAQNYGLTQVLFRGVHEVCRKRINGGVSHTGYFDNVEDLLRMVEHDAGYEAIWASLNPVSALPGGFGLNTLRPSPNRSTKESYERRTALLISLRPVTRAASHVRSRRNQSQQSR